jgi:hypothetical protein
VPQLSEKTMDEAYRRAGGRCECRRGHHGHRFGRCWRVFFGRTKVAFRVIKTEAEGGDDRPHNCEVLCERCADRVRAEESATTQSHPRRR